MKSSFVVFLLLCMPTFATAQQAGAPPALKIVTSIDKAKGEVVFDMTETRYSPVFVEKIVIVNGKEMTVRSTEYVAELRTIREVVKVADSRVITPDGKQLPIDEVWKRLQQNAVVAVSTDHNTPSATYLRALNANTLVIIPSRPKAEPAPK